MGAYATAAPILSLSVLVTLDARAYGAYPWASVGVGVHFAVYPHPFPRVAINDDAVGRPQKRRMGPAPRRKSGSDRNWAKADGSGDVGPGEHNHRVISGDIDYVRVDWIEFK
jgi:hypothetical protein